jgi:hypothetical protein
MSFDVITSKYPQQPQYSSRTHKLDLLLRVVAPEVADGGIYDIPTKGGYGVLSPFDRETNSSKQYIPIMQRRPNVPEGTNTLRNQVQRQAAMVWSRSRAPQIETTNEKARNILNLFVKDANLIDVMRQATILGSIGSAAINMRVLAKPGKPGTNPAKIFPCVFDTRYLTPTFDPWRPGTVVKMTEKYMTEGRALSELGYDIPAQDFAKDWWFMREWSSVGEIWYLPWKDSDEKDAKNAGKMFMPVEDDDRSIRSNSGHNCMWQWVKNLPLDMNAVDGVCQFRQALDHAINLDYLESQIMAGIKYTMQPTLVIQVPAGRVGAPASKSADGSAGFVKSPSTILTIYAEGKAYYLEINAAGLQAAREIAEDLRKAIIEACHGDRVDPSEVTQAHQGAKSIEMLNQPLLGICESLRETYGDAFKTILKMVLKVIRERGEQGELTEISDMIITPEEAAEIGSVPDLDISWGAFYTLTPSEKHAEAQARDLDFKNGFASRERIIQNVSPTYNIPDVAEEMVKIDEDQKREDDRAVALANAQAQVRISDSIN